MRLVINLWLATVLWGIPWAMRVCAMVYPKFKERLKERDAIAQFALKEEPTKGRWVQLKNGRISSGKTPREPPMNARG